MCARGRKEIIRAGAKRIRKVTPVAHAPEAAAVKLLANPSPTVGM